jgi:hypothetical protein
MIALPLSSHWLGICAKLNPHQVSLIVGHYLSGLSELLLLVFNMISKLPVTAVNAIIITCLAIEKKKPCCKASKNCVPLKLSEAFFFPFPHCFGCYGNSFIPVPLYSPGGLHSLQCQCFSTDGAV